MSEITKNVVAEETSGRQYIWWAFIILLVFVYFFGLNIPLLGPDEPRYAQVAREMWERGDWITPTLGGHHWFEKPSLLYWLEMASYSIFGVSEFSARFGSALFGLGTIACLWVLGRFSIAKSDLESSSGSFSNLLAVLGGSTIGIIVFSRGASFDIVLTFPITAALVCFFIFDSNERLDHLRTSWRHAPIIFFYIFVGIALLAKGLIGAILPFGIIGFYYLISFRLPSAKFLLSLLWGLPITIAVAATWYLPMWWRHGYEFIDEFIVQQHFQRYVSNKYHHPQPFYFFLWVMPLMTLPWLPFFIAGIWNFARHLRAKAVDANDSPDFNSIRVFSVAWLLVPVLFFSLSGSKLPGYVLPAVPGAILFTSIYMQRKFRTKRISRYVVDGAAFSVLLLVIALLTLVIPRFADSDSVKVLVNSADAAGYSNEKIIGFHTTSHNAEFYAAGRLVRDKEGRQINFVTDKEVSDWLRNDRVDSALILTPVELADQLSATDLFTAENIANNGELAIVLVKLPALGGPPQSIH